MGRSLKEFLLSIKNKRVAVIGIGVSNTPLIRCLRKEGISVIACDKKSMEDLGPVASELSALGCELRLGEQYLENLDCDIIFRSPGIRPDIPAFERAREKGSIITSEMEVFFQVCPCKIIAVTGSDGKTTTTTLISEMLKKAGYTVHLGGNIGKPLLVETEDMKASDIAVLELSSFQLMTIRQSPSIAVVTNLSPNHLDVHISMEEYREAKEHIYLHQSEGGIVVLNEDNEETKAMAQKAKGRVVRFSRNTLDKGVYVDQETLWISDETGRRALFSLSDILLPGEHNVENYLAAIGAVKDLVSPVVMKEIAGTFRGVEHRIELVRTMEEVRYYNDSIATSPTRAIAGLRSFDEKVILIAGGYDKKIPFDDLGEEICRYAKAVVLTGHTREKIRSAIENAPSYKEGAPMIQMTPDFTEAVMKAHHMAKAGDIVLFSPGCASFDQFPNFAARGNRFKELVASL